MRFIGAMVFFFGIGTTVYAAEAAYRATVHGSAGGYYFIISIVYLAVFLSVMLVHIASED